ncbi:hypothetical protein BT69DRAFT_1321835 [Atractiella rhizophila]|nr:hypothetical protein BT69DRAFT_1321835 [Atractiella rhizophila]
MVHAQFRLISLALTPEEASSIAGHRGYPLLYEKDSHYQIHLLPKMGGNQEHTAKFCLHLQSDWMKDTVPFTPEEETDFGFTVQDGKIVYGKMKVLEEVVEDKEETNGQLIVSEKKHRCNLRCEEEMRYFDETMIQHLRKKEALWLLDDELFVFTRTLEIRIEEMTKRGEMDAVESEMWDRYILFLNMELLIGRVPQFVRTLVADGTETSINLFGVFQYLAGGHGRFIRS